MQKRQSFYVVALFSVALFMTAGCAMQEVVKMDEGVVPASVAKKADQSNSSLTQPKLTASTPVAQITPAQTSAPEQQAQNAPSTSRLQSALQKIYFDFDSADLSASARTTLSKNAATLMKEASAKIVIEGNCDERGSAEYNLALGERRAKSAQQYLIALGVKADRLSTISYGKEKPAVQGRDEAAMAKNRRDEFVVVAK
jgi:peptidoglycan-associated lipoprotein